MSIPPPTAHLPAKSNWALEIAVPNVPTAVSTVQYDIVCYGTVWEITDIMIIIIIYDDHQYVTIMTPMKVERIAEKSKTGKEKRKKKNKKE